MLRKRLFALIMLTLFSWNFSLPQIQAEAKGINQNEVSEILKNSWLAYKEKFISQDGRVIDLFGDGITTSEGQSYALLRAVWMDDKKIFHTVFGWTMANLAVRDDNLFAWKWGRDPKTGQFMVIDKSAASDADQDIALALILASRRWQDPVYLKPAREIVDAIWKKLVVIINEEPYMTAGDWAATSTRPALNVSYLAPYCYRLFEEIDPDRSHKWLKLVDTSYRVLDDSLKLSQVGLPPDWCSINRDTGRLEPAQINGEQSGDYSYDAWRVMWRVAADYQWFDEPRALSFLKKNRFLIDYWKKYEHLSESFGSNGQVRSDQEAISQIGIHLPAFALVDKKVAKRIFETKLMASYDRLGRSGFWGNPKDYYGQNWVWLGIALYVGAAENFSSRGNITVVR